MNLPPMGRESMLRWASSLSTRPTSTAPPKAFVRTSDLGSAYRPTTHLSTMPVMSFRCWAMVSRLPAIAEGAAPPFTVTLTLEDVTKSFFERSTVRSMTP